MITLRSHSVAQTHEIASAIASMIRPRDLILLVGDMGAGKTAFTVGFACALGVSDDDNVSSPTFTLVHSYDSGRIPLLHADLYRLTSIGEVSDLGIREQLDMGAVGLVEWGNVAQEVLGDALVVSLEADDTDDEARTITISVDGHGWDSRWESLKTALRHWSAQ